MARVGTRGAGLSKDIALSVKNKLTHLGANVSDDLARLSGKVEDAFAYADGAVSKNIGKHNARFYQSNGGNWDEVASGILGSSGAGRKAAAEFSDDASQALAKHGDEVSQALKETGEQSGKRASAEFGGETSQDLAKHGDEVSKALKETGEQSGKRASAEFGGETVENSVGHNNTVSEAFQNSPEVHWDGTKWESHTDDIHRKMLEDNVPLTSEVHTIDEIAKQQAEILKVQNGEEALSTNLKKGNFGEMVQDEYYRQFGYDRISKDMVTDLGEGGHQGIDGVYYNPNGHPPYIIAEAKYNTARLGNTVSDGKQMSKEWINNRLLKAVGEENYNKIRLASLQGNVQNNLFNVKSDGSIIVNQLNNAANKMK